jgi:phosphoribosylanthranilate isomerase
MRTRVKICGITRIEDALAAANAGADAIGLVFDKSPRVVTVEQAQLICRVLPPFISVVGLFVDTGFDTVHRVLSRVPVSVLQFHGSEPPEFCRQFGRPYIKAIRMSENVDLAGAQILYADAAGLLLDAFVSGVAGGSGQSFDWSRIPATLEKPIVLAGGLTPENVADAVRRVRPSAVDVSSGVEFAKGVKDAAKISAFIRAVREAA